MKEPVIAYCPHCERKVSAAIMDEDAPKPRAMHLGPEGDHIWTLTQVERDHLVKMRKEGMVE